MNNRDGQVLTQRMTQELIQELFAGQTVQLQQIIQKVDEVHEERSGQAPIFKWHHPVTYALSRMKRIGLANNPERGRWSIFTEEQPQSEEQPRSEGSDLIESLNVFMKWVQELPQGDYVYRGVSNRDYQIEASTYRRLKDKKGEFMNEEDKSAEKLRQINWEMIEDANRHKHGWENNQRLPDLNLLAKLQHSGAATCLIDFTKNPLVALWMACRKSGSGSVHGKIYAIKIAPRSAFQLVSPDEAQKEISHFFQGDEKIGYQLYQWQPDYQDNRMLAQQSVFLFGGGWGEIKPSKECVISKQHKQEIRDSLKKSAGISEDILFPDFEGFASQRAQNKAYNQPEAPIDKDLVLALPENLTDETIDDKEQKESPAIYHLQLSLQAYREDKTEAAVQHYNNGMEFKPSDGLLNDFYRERAIIYLDKGYFQSAIYDYNEAIYFNPNDADSYFGRGRVNYDLSRYTEAIADFDMAINLNSNNANTHYWRGLAKYSLQQYPEAIVDFDMAINLNPIDAYFYQWRGMATSGLERYQEAIGYFDRAISLNPAHAHSYHWRGLAKYSLQQYPKAVDDFDQAINLNPTDVRANAHSYYWRGMVKKQIGVFGAAQADFRTALMCAEETQNHDLIALINQELLS